MSASLFHVLCHGVGCADADARGLPVSRGTGSVWRALRALGAFAAGAAMGSTDAMSADTSATVPAVRVGVYSNAPKIDLDGEGRGTGILMDLLREIALAEGWTLQEVPCQWQACLRLLQDKHIDLMPDVARTPERATLFDFHDTPALRSWSQIFARAETPIASMLDLEGRRVAVLSGSVQERYLATQTREFGLKADILGYASFDDVLEAVDAGLADAGAVNHHFGRYNARRFAVVETPLVFQPAELFYATAKGHRADLLSAVERHLKAWHAVPGSTYYQVLERWQMHDTQVPAVRRAATVAAALAALLLLAVGTAWALRQRLKARAADAAQAEAQRDEAQAQSAQDARDLAATFEQAAVGIAMVGPDGRWLRVNQRLCDIVGYTRDELLALTFQDITHPEDLGPDLALVQRMLDGVISTYTLEKRYLRKGGGIVWINLTVGLVRDAQNRPDFFVSVIEDIQARKQAQAALAESEARLELFFEHAPAALAMLDTDMCYLVVSRRWRDAYRLGDMPLVGRSHYEVFPEIPERWRELHRRALAGEVLRADGDRFDRADGSTMWLRWELRPWRRADGAIGGIVVFSEDVTDLHESSMALSRARDRLEEQVELRTGELRLAREAAESASLAKGDFLAKMSHEIRTPLNAIVGMVSLIRHEGSQVSLPQRLGVIESSSRHLLAIISDILDLTKIEAGKMELEQCPLDPGALLDEVAAMLRAAVGDKPLRIRTSQVKPMPRQLIGDPVRIRQCLLNLAGNAVKFTERGDVLLSATVDTHDDGHAVVRFKVEDTGAGIPPEALRRLFTPFEQADNSVTRKYGGTGLGLAITLKLAQQMGGTAGASSVPGRGSTFWFTARLGCAAEPVEPLASEPDLTASDAPSLCAALRERHGGRRLLLVEDNELNRLVAQEMLRSTGLAVDVAYDGMEALDVFDADLHSLVLMDVHMPHMGGLEATRRLRGVAGASRTPILAMTADVRPEDIDACRAAGMDDFISKPCDLDQLLAAVLRWLDASAGFSPRPRSPSEVAGRA